MFGCYFLEACYFLKRNRNGINPMCEAGLEELGGVEGGKTIIIICIMRKNLFSIKIKLS